MPTYLCHSTCCYVKQEAPKKQHCARGGTNKWGQNRLHKQAHGKSIAESLHVCINRTRLTACEVGTSQLWKIRPALSLRSSWSSSPMSVFPETAHHYIHVFYSVNSSAAMALGFSFRITQIGQMYPVVNNLVYSFHYRSHHCSCFKGFCKWSWQRNCLVKLSSLILRKDWDNRWVCLFFTFFATENGFTTNDKVLNNPGHLWLEPAVSWVRLPVTASFFTFLYFRLITSKFPAWGKMLWA